MVDYKKLCDELRANRHSETNLSDLQLCIIAADAIEELRIENEQLRKYLSYAEECIGECEEAFSNRCHDDYAEEAIEKWNTQMEVQG